MSDDKGKRNADPETMELESGKKNRFNAGGNASDYDGGQPQDSRQGSEGRIRSETESAPGPSSDRDKNDFNSGGNDSDYDGGQPDDVKNDSEGRIQSAEDQ